MITADTGGRKIIEFTEDFCDRVINLVLMSLFALDVIIESANRVGYGALHRDPVS